MLNNGVISGDHDVGLIAPMKNNSFKLLPAWLMLNLVFCLLQLAWTSHVVCRTGIILFGTKSVAWLFS